LANAASAELAVKPLLRGVLHQGAFVAAIIVAPLLILSADGSRTRLAATVFALSVIGCFGVSALYHRVTWTPSVRRWMRRADHAGVYLLIAGTYTPVALLVLDGTWGRVILTVVWAGALAAILLKFVWLDAPKWVAAGIGLALGWIAVFALPDILDTSANVAADLSVVTIVSRLLGRRVWRRVRPHSCASER